MSVSELMNVALSVMVGLAPTIHVLASLIACGVQDVDARHKGEHDGVRVEADWWVAATRWLFRIMAQTT